MSLIGTILAACFAIGMCVASFAITNYALNHNW
jgi:hypothetical protein